MGSLDAGQKGQYNVGSIFDENRHKMLINLQRLFVLHDKDGTLIAHQFRKSACDFVLLHQFDLMERLLWL